MVTKIVKINDCITDVEILEEAGNIIKKGGLVAFPTETVYGLGGDALAQESCEKIYLAKGRPSDNPLIVHIAKLEDIDYIVKKRTDKAGKLAKEFWPGPLTMILEKSENVPHTTTGGLDTVAVRMPQNELALKFIELAGGYVAAPSANLSGRPSPTTSKHVIDDMYGRIDMIIDSDVADIGIESTIIDLTTDIPMILRPGAISLDMIKGVIGDTIYDPAIIKVEGDARPKAPGMKYKHYAPKADLTIIEGDTELVYSRINKLANIQMKKGEKVGIICASETKSKYVGDIIKDIGSRNNEKIIAKNLYSILREFDDEEVSVIYSESFEVGGIGQAIMNRLLKAAGYQVEKVKG